MIKKVKSIIKEPYFDTEFNEVGEELEDIL